MGRLKPIKVATTVLCLCFNYITFAASYPPAAGKHAMVVTAQPLATQVGLDILKQGGNAIDAAVAIGYTLAIVSPCCGNIGGGGFMLIHLANGTNTFLNFREKAPQNIKRSMYFNTQGELEKNRIRYGYLAAGIPGTVMGLNTALKKYGTMPLKQVLKPAIHLAKNGFTLTASDIKFLSYANSAFVKQPNIAKIFLHNGKLYQAGEILKQKDLANTLQLIADNGNKAFYDGPITKAMITASQQHGGVFTKKDFQDYTVQWLEPITCRYRDYTIISAPPPSSGGIVLCEMLTILAPYPLSMMGFHSAQSTHYTVEAMRQAFYDRNHYLGDPDFIKIPAAKLLSAEYAARVRKNIEPFRAGNSKNNSAGFIHSNEKMETTHYAVVDKYGNAVAVTYTINGYFGARVIPGNTGFFLNDEMDDFAVSTKRPNIFKLIQGQANLLAPNKRPLSSMMPTMVFKDDKLYMVLGAAGGPTIITQVLEIIQNVIDYGMNIQEALDMPRFHMQWLPDVIYYEPFAFSLDTIEKLNFMGYRLTAGSPYQTGTLGRSEAILHDQKTRMYHGASDNRVSPGLARGY